jgi:aarF domain-containing kinase
LNGELKKTFLLSTIYFYLVPGSIIETMLRAGLGTGASRFVTGTAKLVCGSAALGVTGVGVYASTEQGQGARREIRFWSKVAPVVFDYYWNFAQSSPFVKYQNYVLTNQDGAQKSEDDKSGAPAVKEEEQKRIRRAKINQLHEQHASEILNVFIELKGLYVKLGQVLSVTTLPLPDAYRDNFKTLQSDVPGWETFDDKVKPLLERELGKCIEDVFVSIDPVPCGAASIGQAHKAVLRSPSKPNSDDRKEEEDEGQVVIVKIQYPDAAWQIPADIQCVGDLLKVCVFFGVIDENAANLSFNEFSRQFLTELDYDQERQNLEAIYQSSLDPEAPYIRRGVVVPFAYPDLCTSKVITMQYLPGPKLEEEARRQLEALGIDTKRSMKSLIRAPADSEKSTTDRREANFNSKESISVEAATEMTLWQSSLKQRVAQFVLKFISVDFIFGAMGLARRLQLWCTATTVQGINVVSATPVTVGLVPSSVQDWAEIYSTASQQAKRLALTKDWIDALFDVHAHQIFNLGCFNADAHPGNILVIDEDTDHPKLGLIDFGQCKRLTAQEQAQIGRLLVCVASKESDDNIATAFRELGVQTKNDNPEFLAKFAKLMFGPLQSYHLNHSWHQELHKQDSLTYFPNQLSMVYRTSMLLRGLAMSLQINVSVGDLWKSQAQEAIDRMDKSLMTSLTDDAEVARPQISAGQGLTRRYTTTLVMEDLSECSENPTVSANTA